MVSFSQLAESFNVFDGNSWAAIPAMIGKALYSLIIVAIGRVCDVCQLLFRKFAGMDTVKVNGQDYSGDLVLSFLNSDIVRNTFIALLVLAIVLLFISCFVAVIKSEFNKDGNNSKKGIIKNAFRAIVNFLAVPIISIFALVVSNVLLKAIDGATNISNAQTSISSQIFLAGGYNSNRARQSELDDIGTYKSNSFGYMLTQGGSSNVGYASFGIFYDDQTGVNKLRAADKIDDAFGQNLTIKIDSSLNDVERVLLYDSDYIDFYYKGVGVSLPDGMDMNYNDIGVQYEIGDSVTFSIYNIGLVSYYYDLSIGSFDYIITAIALIYTAYVFVTLLLGLIKRLFMLIVLFIISPPICAIYPIDGGAALGEWRKAFRRQALAAYAPIVILNIFIMLLPFFLSIELFPTGASSSSSANVLLSGGLTTGLGTSTLLASSTDMFGIATGFINYIAKVLIVLAAITFVNDGCKTISDILGADDIYDTSRKQKGEFNKNVAKAGAGVALAGGAAVGIGKFVGKGIGATTRFAKDTYQGGFKHTVSDRAGKLATAMFGEKDANGKRSAKQIAGGLIKTPFKVAGKGINTGLSAYKNVAGASNLSNGVKASYGTLSKLPKVFKKTEKPDGKLYGSRLDYAKAKRAAPMLKLNRTNAEFMKNNLNKLGAKFTMATTPSPEVSEAYSEAHKNLSARNRVLKRDKEKFKGEIKDINKMSGKEIDAAIEAEEKDIQDKAAQKQAMNENKENK